MTTDVTVPRNVLAESVQSGSSSVPRDPVMPSMLELSGPATEMPR